MKQTKVSPCRPWCPWSDQCPLISARLPHSHRQLDSKLRRRNLEMMGKAGPSLWPVLGPHMSSVLGSAETETGADQ